MKRTRRALALGKTTLRRLSDELAWVSGGTLDTLKSNTTCPGDGNCAGKPTDQLSACIKCAPPATGIICP